jgi:hypothetical protein
MVNAQQIPWTRLAVEAAAIVVSILLAFAIDAWWSDRVARQQEVQALVRLREDFNETARLFEVARAGHLRQQAGVDAMFSLIPAAGDPPNSYQIPDSVLWGMYGTERFMPPLGAVSSLINSGEIRLIGNETLRFGLTSWLEVVAVLNKTEDEERHVYEQFQLPQMFRYVPFVSVGFRLEIDGYNSRSPSEGDYRALLTSLPFENVIEWRVAKKTEILSQYEDVSDKLEVILHLLNRELGD